MRTSSCNIKCQLGGRASARLDKFGEKLLVTAPSADVLRTTAATPIWGMNLTKPAVTTSKEPLIVSFMPAGGSWAEPT